MKLTDNFDYLYVKSHMQSKYDDIDFLPKDLRNSIKAVLKICEEQEKTIEKLENEIKYINCMRGGFTYDNKQLLNCEYGKQANKQILLSLQKENKKLKQLLTYCFEEGLIGE